MPPCSARFSITMHLVIVFEFFHQCFYLIATKAWQNLLQFFERSSNSIVLTYMFQQQLLVSITIQTDTPCMDAGFTRGCIKTSCKNIFLASNMLNNTHACQSIQAGLHFWRECTLVVQRVNGQEILGGQKFATVFTDSVDNRKHCFIKNQSVQRDNHKKIVRSCKIGKGFCLLHTQLEHQIHALSGALHHTA